MTEYFMNSYGFINLHLYIRLQILVDSKKYLFLIFSNFNCKNNIFADQKLAQN